MAWARKVSSNTTAPASAAVHVDTGARVWTEEQIPIFDWFESGNDNLKVIARAGTGKSTTIAAGIARATGARLAAAFNTRIANELKPRVPTDVDAKTLHAIGFGLVRENAPRTKVQGEAAQRSNKRAMDLARAVLGPSANYHLLKAVAKLHTFVREIIPVGASVEQVDALAERFEVEAPEYLQDAWPVRALAEAALQCVTLAKNQVHDIDFADMIFLPLVHGWVEPHYDMVVVDEAQDMTRAQLDLALAVMDVGGRMAIVGDDRQAIYGFRGADSGSLNRVGKHLKARTLGLKTTFRCAQAITALARTLVPDIEAAPSNPEGTIDTANTEDVLAGARVNDFILSRLNAPLAPIAMGLLRKGVRTRVAGKDIGRDLIRIMDAQKDVRSMDELRRAIRTWERSRVEHCLAQGWESQANKVTDNCAALIDLIADAGTATQAKAHIEHLFSDNNEGDVVMCSTVHKAKGLERDRVWVLENTLKAEEGGEEANIAYVAYTRAKSTLMRVY